MNCVSKIFNVFSKKVSLLFVLAFFVCFCGFSQTLRSMDLKSMSTDAKKNASTKRSASNSKLDASDSVISNPMTNSLVPNVQVAMSSSEYMVTAGDVYLLAYAMGSNTVSFSLPIDSSYKLRVANLGILNARGKTFIELKEQVENLVTKNFPMSGVQFALTNPAVFDVTISGEVDRTVEKRAWALTRLSSIISEEILTDYSSKRNILIRSSNGAEKRCDLFKAERFGDMKNDPYLRPGDLVIVSRTERIVEITGAVERPGIYELLEGENIKSLISYYGAGLLPLADMSRIEIQHLKSDKSKTGKTVYIGQAEFDADCSIEAYDVVNIPTYDDLKPSIFVEGAIATQATDELDTSNRIVSTFITGENYASFVRRNKDWFSAISDIEGAYIKRGEEKIPINIYQIIYNENFEFSESLERNDTLVIPFRQYFVTVSGAVQVPGRYPYIPDRDWEYYIGLAGGFVKTQNARSKVVIRNADGKKMSKNDVISPETTIEASTNSGLYYFNQYAPIITTILSVISTSLSVMAITGAL